MTYRVASRALEELCVPAGGIGDGRVASHARLHEDQEPGPGVSDGRVAGRARAEEAGGCAIIGDGGGAGRARIAEKYGYELGGAIGDGSITRRTRTLER